MDKIILKKSIPRWIKQLASFRIFSPVAKDGLWEYEEIKQLDDFPKEYTNTVVPLKKFLFPHREELFEFADPQNGGPEIKEILPEAKPMVVFGVRPCDARAAHLLSKVFGGDIPDVYFQKHQDLVYLVGLACSSPPSDSCFCISVEGSPFSEEGLDILLIDLGEKYLVRILSEKGKNLIKANGDLFETALKKDQERAQELEKEAEKKISTKVKSVDKIPPKLKDMFDSPLWEEESFRCLKCGICTYLCPTCHCFDISDELVSTFPLRGKRVRVWDNCQFPDFTMHSSGHNPRPDKSSRLRQRIFHKFYYFVENQKDYLCTGCGRCVAKCPVGIDIVEILNKVESHGK